VYERLEEEEGEIELAESLISKARGNGSPAGCACVWGSGECCSDNTNHSEQSRL